jgi:hypothetical protein
MEVKNIRQNLFQILVIKREERKILDLEIYKILNKIV